MNEVNKLKILLSREFDMKDLGATKKILRMEIRRERAIGRLWLSHSGYVRKVLERFNMENEKPVSRPLANHFRLSTTQCPKTDDDVHDMSKVPYASVVMYAMVCTRLDLAQAISAINKFLSNLGRSHWDAFKWIFRYLRGTIDYDIMFKRQQSVPLVIGYVDVDYARDLVDRRSTTGYMFTLGGGPICWKSMVESLIALSTIESEYMEIAEAAKEASSLAELAKELGIQ